MQIFLAILGIVVVLCIVNVWYILATFVLVVVFYFLRVFYLSTSRDVKRLEAVSKWILHIPFSWQYLIL